MSSTNDEFLIEDDDAFVTPAEAAEVEVMEPARKGLGVKSLIATGLIAAILGALGGGAIAHTFRSEAPNLSALEARMKAQNAQAIEAMQRRLSQAEADVKAARNAVPDMSDLPAMPDLTPLEDRLNALENTPSPEIDTEALAALQSAQEDGFDWPDTEQIEAVLMSLDQRLTAMDDRLTDVESRPVSEVTAAASAPGFSMAVTPEPQTKFVLAFPKAAMVKAVEDMREGGFLERAFSKHVRVKTENDPMTLIAGIESDIAEGRLDLAANKYERLPEPVRKAGQAWYNSVKAAQ